MDQLLMGLDIAMLSIHSSPVGALGTQHTGGMSVYVRETARALGRMGHRVDIFTQQNGDRAGSSLNLYDNVRLIRLPGGVTENIDKTLLYRYLPNLLTDLKAFQHQRRRTYDVIHSHYWLSGVLGQMIQAWWGVPHLLNYHTIGAMKDRIDGAAKEPELRLTNEKRLAKTCAAIIVSDIREKQDLLRYVAAAEENVRVVPCGVKLERFKPTNKASARRQLNFSDQAGIILCVGRHSSVKGLDRLLAAMSQLKHIASLRLVLVGGDGEDSPMYEHLQTMSKRLHIHRRVIFAGRIPQRSLPLWYSAADVLALPSDYESFGLVALEALACGTPVVATPVGAMAKIIQHGSTGYVADNFDPQHFARLLEAAVLEQRRGGYSQADIRASVAGLTWEKSASLLLGVYQDAIGNQSAR